MAVEPIMGVPAGEPPRSFDAATPTATGPSLQDVVARAQEAVRDLSEHSERLRDRGRLGGTLALAALPQIDHLVLSVGLVQARLVGLAQEHASRDDLDGEPNFTSFRARSTREGRGAGLAQEKVARALQEIQGLREAAVGGEVSRGHVDAVAQALGGADEAQREELARRAPEILVAARELTAPELRRKLDADLAALAVDRADHTFAVVRERRYLRTSARGGGVMVDGFLDPVAGATLQAAIDAVTPAPAAGDTRSGQQRAADGLLALADRALSIGLDKAGAQVRPHLSVLVREDTWYLLMHRRRQQATGCRESDRTSSEAFGTSGLSHKPPLAQLVDGTLLPFAALEVMLCDSLVQRVVLDPVGEAVDVGREQRTYSRSVRRAVLARDRHCQWPSCGLRAAWSQVHHITYWSQGGPTDQGNGITLCSNHHHLVHDRAVRIMPAPGGFVFSWRDGRRIGTTTRLHDELLVPRAAKMATPRQAGELRLVPEPHREPRPDPGGGPPCGDPPGGGPPGAPPPAGSASDEALPPGCPALLW